MQKTSLPYANQLVFKNEIRIYWGSNAAWSLAKNKREYGDKSCLVLPENKPISSFDLSLFINKSVVICECFSATRQEEKELALVLLKNGVKEGVFLRFTPTPNRYQLFGDTLINAIGGRVAA